MRKAPDPTHIYYKAGLIAKTVTVDQVVDPSVGEEVLKEMGR